ncbi:hypothetical protein [Cytobacillus oceanisediminis]|uniref:Uncharacterized protein n=1 Tax=Cytobacillus oceanisediminis 2691 TaxID=1196031 RepID=A0A160MEC6_9BACI|nr:hypothetical protein [Cytobacillus oceanisediminis]AND41492.1 hypothetical protein A361_20775 [Cytobacillus oceanisediminis 2691]
MIKKLLLGASSFLLFSFFLTPINTYALTFDNLPIKQTSKQWEVRIGEAGQGKGMVKPVKGKFQTYSLEVENIGKDVFSVEINLFRNEPNSKTKFSLHSCPHGWDCNNDNYERAISLARTLNTNGNFFRHSNFLLAEKATELEVEIVWTQGKDGRRLKETFTFTD